jgi:hypothetical protein
MSAPDAYLAQLQTALAAAPMVSAAWLGGSYGRGAADRWSDIDLHLLLADEGEGFRAACESWLQAIRPLVLYKLLFEGRMVNAMTVDGVRLDVWLYEAPPVLNALATHVLFDHDGRLQFEPPAPPARGAQPDTAAALRGLMEEFWRCISLLPTVAGRQEYIVAFQGLNVELNLLLEILQRGHEVVREAGVKRLNDSLPGTTRAEIEAALALARLDRAALVAAHLKLADIVRVEGRQLAARWGFVYPAALEEAVLSYVARELAQLDPPGEGR